MNIRKKETRKHLANRLHEEYESYHGCAAWRGEERTRIRQTGQLESHCDWCGGRVTSTINLDTGERHYYERPACKHPGYWLEYQCVNCRYHCHKTEKAKAHRLEHGHKVVLVRVYWRIERNNLKS